MAVISTYKVDRLHPVVLIGGHVQFFENVSRRTDLQDLDIRSIGIVNLGVFISFA